VATAPPISVEDEMRQRAHECGLKIEQVLASFRCRIVPYLMPIEPVGRDGSRALVQASFGVIPQE
jgi:hypothetical protein